MPALLLLLLAAAVAACGGEVRALRLRLDQTNDAWAHRFDSEGEFAYECYFCFCNPMKGRVVVTATAPARPVLR